MIGELLVLSAGAGLGCGLHLWIAWREEGGRATKRTPLSLTFPIGLSSEAAAAALSTLAGSAGSRGVVLEVRATPGVVRHLVYVPDATATTAAAQLRAALPGIRVEAIGSPGTDASVAVGLRLVAARGVLRTDEAER